jgi:segregation and condensation protein B
VTRRKKSEAPPKKKGAPSEAPEATEIAPVPADAVPADVPPEQGEVGDTVMPPDMPAFYAEHPGADAADAPDAADATRASGKATVPGGMRASGVVQPPQGWDEQPTVNLTGGELPFPERDDVAEDAAAGVEQARELSRAHLRGLLEALVFASDKPMKAIELARLASAPVRQVRELLAELKAASAGRGVVLDEVAGGWLFRTSVEYAPFVRELASEKPVRLTRAQVETLAIVAYRQPITRPEVDDIRGVDSGATMKLLLERDLVRILGKKDEPGRPILYGTTTAFLEFFGLKSLKDLPTLKEFTELTDESRRIAEAELGEVVDPSPPTSVTEPHLDIPPTSSGQPVPSEPAHSDTLTPPPEHDTIAPPAPLASDPAIPAPAPSGGGGGMTGAATADPPDGSDEDED